MNRSDRLKRIDAVLATTEQRARHELARATGALALTEAGLASVLDQCRDIQYMTGQPSACLPDHPCQPGADGSSADLSFVAGLALVQSGLAEAGKRETNRAAALGDVAKKSAVWSAASGRHEAAIRILDRWQTEVDAEAARTVATEIDEVIAARRSMAARPSSGARTAITPIALAARTPTTAIDREDGQR